MYLLVFPLMIPLITLSGLRLILILLDVHLTVFAAFST